MPAALAAAARALGIDLPDGAAACLARYRDLLAAAARRSSITAVREPAAIERRHILESLLLGDVLRRSGLLRPGARVIDIGSGAGLPGLPIRTAWPDFHLALLEANARKCSFLRDVVRELSLSDIVVLQARAEELGRDAAHRETYDLALARAVAPLPVLLEYALPLLRTSGHLAAPKGSAAARELQAATRALEVLGGRLQQHLELRPPQGPPQTLIIIEKTAPTPARFPRRPGLPAKRPMV